MTEIKKIWCVRHAAYVPFQEGGHPNDPVLRLLGIEQAKRLHDVFGDREIDEIRISPLKRARQTFEHADLGGKRVMFDTRLLEIANTARYETLMPYTLPDYAEADTANAWMVEGEKRAADLLEDLKASPSQEILLFSHWAFLGTFLMTALGVSAGEHPLSAYARTNHAGYSLLEMEKEKPLRIIHWNITAHLNGLPPSTEQKGRPPIHPTDATS